MARIAARFTALLFGIFLGIATVAADEPATSDAFVLLALLNEARAEAGQPPLVMQPAMHAFASAWATELSAQQRLEHRTDTSQINWIEANVTARWQHIGENIAFAHSVREAHAVLMASPVHRANALGDFTHVGIGVASDSTGELWVAYNFVTAPALRAIEVAAAFAAPLSSDLRRPVDAADRAIETIARTDLPTP